jgi:hypothetical protein
MVAGLLGLGVAVGVYQTRAAERNAAGPEKKRPQTSQPPAHEKPARQYEFDVQLVEADPQGRDLGDGVKGKVLTEPKLMTMEGREATLWSGGEQAVQIGKAKDVEFIPFGTSIRLTCSYLTARTVRLKCEFERTEAPETSPKSWQVHGRITRFIGEVKLGEPVKLVEKDEQGNPRYWLRITVHHVEDRISIIRRPPPEPSPVLPPPTGELPR